MPRINAQRSDIYLGLLLVVFINGIIVQSFGDGLLNLVISVLNTNLFLLFAFYALFDLLVEGKDDCGSGVADYLICISALLSLLFFGRMGISHDVGLVTLALAALFWFRRDVGNSKYIAVIWFALTLNLLIAPFLFQLFKGFILVAEVEFVAHLWRLFGFDVWSDGQLLVLDHGMKIRMIGACSVFTNLSFGFLCYATVKAFNRKQMVYSDVIMVGTLIVLLVLGNTIRIGLMLPSLADYEFWHHGFGATIFGLVQFSIIASVSYFSIPTGKLNR